MKEYTLKLGGMSCGACKCVIEKVVQRNGAEVKNIDVNNGKVIILSEESKIGSIKVELAKRGFPEKGSGEDIGRGNMKNVLNYISAILSIQPHVEEEARLLNHALIAGIALLGLNIIAYIFFVQRMENGAKYLPFLILGIAASISIVFAYLHSRCFGKNMACQNGMMVGMTMGMVPGFMVGEIIAATNGMFIGSIAGMITGIWIGVKSGKCCGVMGAMEGIMAGIMAGIMGPMTVIMTLNDNLLPMLYLIFIASIFLLGGLSYMLYREEGETPSEKKSSLTEFMLFSIAFNVVILAIMLFGPRGPLRYV